MDFQNTRLSRKRSITDYAKVQVLIGRLVRGRQWLQGDISGKEYLNIGCGPYPHPAFINLDHWWSPDIELCWDLPKPLPLANESIRGIFSEQCLQDLTRAACRSVFREFWRILKPGGVVRLILPDAELYLDLYRRYKAGEAVTFPYAEIHPHFTPLMHVDRCFRNNGEVQSAYDFETLVLMLREAGFSDVQRTAFGQGRDAALVIDKPHRRPESFYAEAVK